MAKKIFTDESLQTFVDEIKAYTDDAVSTKSNIHDHPYLSTSTKYAASASVGGSATSAEKMNITRIATAITDIAASLPVRSEAVYFGGSDAVSYGCPTTYCIINIKKGDNHRTILDCYNLNTGDHYINGCMNTSDTTNNPWTGWRLQPNESHTHDDRYYTESEIDSKLAGKANSSHSHTIANITNLQSTLDGKAASSHTHDSADITVDQTFDYIEAESNLESVLSSVDYELNRLYALPSSLINSHNTNTSAHSDIRELISNHTHDDYMPLNPESINMTGTKIYTNGSTTHGIQVNNDGSFVIGNLEDPYSYNDRVLIFSNGMFMLNDYDIYKFFYGDTTQVVGSYTGNGTARTISVSTHSNVAQYLLLVFSSTGFGFVTPKGGVWFGGSGANYYNNNVIYSAQGNFCADITVKSTSCLFNTSGTTYNYVVIYS